MQKNIFMPLLIGIMIMLSFTACGNKSVTSDSNSASNVSINDIHQSIMDAYGENYLPNTDIPSEMLESEFGLKDDMYTEIIAKMPTIGFHPDRVIIVKAKDGKADDVEKALKKARENKINESVQYPANVAKVNASEIVRNGNYVAFLLVGAPDDNIDATESEASEFAKKETEKSIKAFNDSFK